MTVLRDLNAAGAVQCLNAAFETVCGMYAIRDHAEQVEEVQQLATGDFINELINVMPAMIPIPEACKMLLAVLKGEVSQKYVKNIIIV